MIDPRDVGAAAAACMLTTPATTGGAYVLTGPAAITYAEVAAELSAATGRDVEFVDVPDEDARRGDDRGGPAGLRRASRSSRSSRWRARASPSEVTGTVESLTGRPPRDFAAFAREHARLFAPGRRGGAEPDRVREAA